MESKQIKIILEQFNTTNTYKKIFINGDWGIGKSYYTNEYKNDNSDNIVYISLFGKSSYESIENAIANELMNKLNKIDKFKKKAKKMIKRINGSISLSGISISTPEYNRKTLIEEFSKMLDKKELIIIIDDLERKSGNILIEDIMGMIEEFSLLKKIKIVIIGDEKNISLEDLKKWNKFKEKIIEKEYKITSFSDDAIYNLITDEIKNYIDNNEIKSFIDNYIKKHKIKNLRTIIKGINLFKEIINNYIHIINNQRVNLMLLKNCISVAIECTEHLYEPDDNIREKNPFQYSIDKDLTSRIINHYFNEIYVNNNDSCALYYVLKIFNCEHNEEIINELNDIIKNYLKLDFKEKNNFYLSEKQISLNIKKIYNSIKNNMYEYISLDKFIDDFYEISTWNEILDLKIDVNEMSNYFNAILFRKYYDINKNFYKNTIDRFELKRRESKPLSDLIDNYNKEVNNKYINDKFLAIEKSFKNKEFNEDLLEWLELRLIQDDKDFIIKQFIILCRNNTYLIPNINGEISDNLWSWIHKLWKLFYEKMNDEYKNELNQYVETLKTNKISSYRINALQEYRPLISKKK